MTNIPGARRVTEPGETLSDAPQTPSTGLEGGPIVTVRPDSLDAVRIAARSKTYPNSETERRVVDAVDSAVFDRVRVVEQGLVENANRAVERHDAQVTAAGEITEALDALSLRVARGASPSELAEEFQALHARAQRVQRQLADAQRDFNWHAGKLADPYAAAQHAYSRLPLSSYRPIDPSPYLV